MKRRPALSKAELEVARIVWDLQEATVRQVIERLPKKRRKDVNYKTVQTYIRRLEAKGYVNSKRDGRSKTYRARVRPAQVVRETVSDFVNRLFDGEALSLVEHYVRDQGLGPKEIKELRSLLDRLEAEKNESRKQR